MVIIGVVVAIAVPRFAQANARQQLSAAADRLASDLEQAQHTARMTSHLVWVTFDTSGGNYTVFPLASDQFKVELDEAPYSVELTKALFQGLPLMAFNGYGIPSSSGSITLSSSAGIVVISVDENGEVTR